MRAAEPIWYLTKDGDKSCIELYERHYSCYHYRDGRERTQCVGPGEVIFLRTADADAIFVWRKYIDDTIPKQTGVECACFRNEAPHRYLSSELVRQADAIADYCWPSQRHYTKVRASALRCPDSRYRKPKQPGRCFIKAGWKFCGLTQNGLYILDRHPLPHDEAPR